MKNLIRTAGLAMVLAGLSQASMAACSQPSATRVSALSTLLSGNTVCVPSSKPGWGWEWQEWHQGGTGATTGTLTDYKRGPGHPVDPSKDVGTWQITGNNTGRAIVVHTYGPGLVYTYQVWNNGDGTYSFCSANPEIKATIKTGSGPCP